MTDVDEFYDEATDEFPRVADLVPAANNMIKSEVQGRLVAVWAIKNGTDTNDRGEKYPYTEAIVLVLDDGPDGKQTTDLIGPAPVEVPLRFSTTGTYARLNGRVDGMTKPRYSDDGSLIAPAVPMRFRPYIGRMNGRPSTKVKNGSPSISISKPTPADIEIAKKYQAMCLEINERLAKKEAEAEDAKAFE